MAFSLFKAFVLTCVSLESIGATVAINPSASQLTTMSLDQLINYGLLADYKLNT